MSIIFPNENEMSPENLIMFKKDLTELLYNDSYNINELNKIKTIIRRLEGYLLMADKKKLFNYFNAFYELGLLNLLNSYLDKGYQQISFCILECIYILLTNIQNNGLIFFLYSTKYTTKNQFPLLQKSFSLYNNKDAMIRSAVKNIFLTILKINDEHLRRFMTSFPNNIYLPNIIFQLRNIIIKLCIINFYEDNNKNNSINKFRDEHDNLIDYMYYISDILLLNIPNANFILINCILTQIILPLFKTMISKKEEKISIVFSLYVLILFIFIVKNKFITDIISYFLFEENVSKNLLDKVKEFEFKAINQNLMSCINFLIVNNKIADVNDVQWRTIQKYMSEICGTDLSTGFIEKENIFDIIKNEIYDNSGNSITVKNEIFSTITMLLTARDDSILLILNLLIHCEILFYKDIKEVNKKENLNNNENDNENKKEAKLININEIENYINNENKNNINNINNENIKKGNIINDEIIDKIKDELIDDDEGNSNENKQNIDKNIYTKTKDINNIKNIEINQNFNILDKDFFKSNLNNPNCLFNLLLKLFLIPRNLRSLINRRIKKNLPEKFKKFLKMKYQN